MKRISMSVPEDIWKNFKQKQERMNKVYNQLTNKNKKIPMIQVIRLSSQNPIFLHDPDLIKMVGSGKKRRI